MLPYNTKFPIFLPGNNPFSVLVVKDAHNQVYHQRVRLTLTQVRSIYWIPRGRKFVKRVISKCTLCKFIDGNPFSVPPPPDLRVNLSPPFTNVGTDHVGPLYVRDIYKPAKLYKAFIALFSCCTTRMIHLEIQPNLEASATLRAMKRTFSRVGKPKLIISDNHKTFKAKLVKNFASMQSIKWKHIHELAPHWGGFYERMNTTIKGALRKTLRSSRLTYEELETIVVEIECIINSRPLCYLYDEEIDEPLTPSHLMYGRRLLTVNHNVPDENEIETKPKERYEYLKRIMIQFWKMFQH